MWAAVYQLEDDTPRRCALVKPVYVDPSGPVAAAKGSIETSIRYYNFHVASLLFYLDPILVCFKTSSIYFNSRHASLLDDQYREMLILSSVFCFLIYFYLDSIFYANIFTISLIYLF